MRETAQLYKVATQMGNRDLRKMVPDHGDRE